MNAEIGIIGGSGLYDMAELTDREEVTLDDAVRRSVRALRARHAARQARGVPGAARRGHRLLPSELNFRANIYGIKMLGVERILSASAVGSLKEEYKPLDIVVPDQFFDRTRGPHQHVLRPRPRRARRLRASDLRHAVGDRRRRAAQTVGATVHRGGTYVCMEGPQFSTLAESRLYRSWGMDVIGMTNLQEAKLAREAEICYATIALVTDYDCWHPDHDSVTVDMIIANLIAEREDRAAAHRRSRAAGAGDAHLRLRGRARDAPSSRGPTRFRRQSRRSWRRSSASTCKCEVPMRSAME